MQLMNPAASPTLLNSCTSSPTPLATGHQTLILEWGMALGAHIDRRFQYTFQMTRMKNP